MRFLDFFSKRRQLDFERLNTGWRIRVIPHKNSNSLGVLAYLPAIGAFGFIIGLALAVCRNSHFRQVGIDLLMGGMAVMFSGLWLVAMKKRQGWIIVAGRCIDREMKQVISSNGEHNGLVWVWRMLCEYEYNGIKHVVTPDVGWRSFASKEAALKYFNTRVSANGECELRINPQIPLQTELAGHDVLRKLFF